MDIWGIVWRVVLGLIVVALVWFLIGKLVGVAGSVSGGEAQGAVHSLTVGTQGDSVGNSDPSGVAYMLAAVRELTGSSGYWIAIVGAMLGLPAILLTALVIRLVSRAFR